MFCPFLDYCLCCPLPNVSEKTFGQNIENLTHHQKHCHWKKSGDAQGHLMQCLCSEKRNYSFSSSKKAMILKTSLSLKAPSPQNRRACRSSSERCRWWGCTGESGWKLNHSDHLDIPLMRENRRREVGDEVWGGRSRPGKAPHLITRKRKVMILTIMMMIRNIQELVSESVDEQSWKMSNLLHGPISTHQILPRERRVNRDIFGTSNLQNRTYGISCDE